MTKDSKRLITRIVGSSIVVLIFTYTWSERATLLLAATLALWVVLEEEKTSKRKSESWQFIFATWVAGMFILWGALILKVGTEFLRAAF